MDTSGTPLKAVSQIPQLAIKINDEEASVLMNRPIHHLSDAVATARQMMQHTGQCVVITLGEKGAVFVNQHGAWHAIPPDVTIKSGVGSGDSFLAGLLVALACGETSSTALSWATAAGTANALSIGGGSFTRLEFDNMLRQIQILTL